MSRPRLVHLTTTDMSLDWLLRPQLEAFADAGFEVIGMSAPGPHVDALVASGIQHHAIHSLTRSVAPVRDARAIAELYRAFRKIRPDIVHTHNPKPGVFGRLAARAARVPIVLNTVHGLYATPEDRKRKRAVVYGLEKLAASCSNHELLQNPEDLPVLRRLRIPHEKLTVLGNGVDLSRFNREDGDLAAGSRLRKDLGIDPSTVVIGLVGRLVWEKGYRAVFEAARLLHERNCVFVVVGPDEPGKSAAVGPADRAAAEVHGVRFLGQRTDMVDLYRLFDVYALASHREGFPRSAMEASAMGLPVVATDIRGCRQVVADGVTGTLVPVDNGVALAAALGDLVDNASLRTRQGLAAAERALAEFDDRRVIKTTLGIYEDLLAHSTPAYANALA